MLATISSIFLQATSPLRKDEDIKNANLSSDSKLIILCRSGGRSKSAAEFLTSQGFNHCYNCVHGFEGAHDEYEHRSNVSGWKFDKLPWKQI